MTLTWRQMFTPPYVMAFLEGFLMAAIPGGGLTHVATSNGGGLLVAPNILSLLTGLGLGMLGGIRRIQSLSAPPPTFPTEAPKP